MTPELEPGAGDISQRWSIVAGEVRILHAGFANMCLAPRMMMLRIEHFCLALPGYDVLTSCMPRPKLRLLLTCFARTTGLASGVWVAPRHRVRSHLCTQKLRLWFPGLRYERRGLCVPRWWWATQGHFGVTDVSNTHTSGSVSCLINVALGSYQLTSDVESSYGLFLFRNALKECLYRG